jgi:hypothetical protein
MDHFKHRFGGADPPDDYNPVCDDCGEDNPCPKYPCERLDEYVKQEHEAWKKAEQVLELAMEAEK